MLSMTWRNLVDRVRAFASMRHEQDQHQGAPHYHPRIWLPLAVFVAVDVVIRTREGV
jgi:hypothetical protein